jgi:hypothetical protein
MDSEELKHYHEKLRKLVFRSRVTFKKAKTRQQQLNQIKV